MQSKVKLLQDLSTTLQKNKEALSNLDEAFVSSKPSPDRWSKKEILGHLVDSALNNHRRIILAENQEHLVFEGYTQDRWVQLHDYQRKSWKDLVDSWYLLNQLILSVITSLPEELMTSERTVHNFDRVMFNTLDKSQTSSLSYLIQDYTAHMTHHLSQILES